MKKKIIIGSLIGIFIAIFAIGHRIGSNHLDRELIASMHQYTDQFTADRAADTITSLNEIELDKSEYRQQICQIKKLIERRAKDWRKCTEYAACASALQGDFYSKTEPVIKSFEKIQCP